MVNADQNLGRRGYAVFYEAAYKINFCGLLFLTNHFLILDSPSTLAIFSWPISWNFWPHHQIHLQADQQPSILPNPASTSVLHKWRMQTHICKGSNWICLHQLQLAPKHSSIEEWKHIFTNAPTQYDQPTGHQGTSNPNSRAETCLRKTSNWVSVILWRDRPISGFQDQEPTMQFSSAWAALLQIPHNLFLVSWK